MFFKLKIKHLYCVLCAVPQQLCSCFRHVLYAYKPKPKTYIMGVVSDHNPLRVIQNIPKFFGQHTNIRSVMCQVSGQVRFGCEQLWLRYTFGYTGTCLVCGHERFVSQFKLG